VKLKGIPLSIFPEDTPANFIISGDIHVPQTLGPVTYVGAPYTIDFGDRFAPRVLILEEGKAPRSVEVPGPQKVLIEIAGKEWPHCDPGDIAQIRYHLDADNYDKWPQIRERVLARAAADRLVVWSIRPLVELRAPARARAPARTRSDREILAHYAKAAGLSKDTLETGLDLLD
jgi:hypothetical protein